MKNPSKNRQDESIVTAVLSGDRERFGEIVSKYEAALFRLAQSRLGNEEIAKEVVQETFLCAFKWLASFDSKYNFRTWLWTILLNQCNRFLRKSHYSTVEKRTDGQSHRARDASNHGQNSHSNQESSGPPMDSARPGYFSRESDPETEAMRRESAELLHRALQSLPASQSDALRLRFFGQLKFREIAEVMNCSLSGAKQRVRNGLLAISQSVKHLEPINPIESGEES